MSTTPAVRIVNVALRLGEAWTRLPFRYGNACLTAVPTLVVEVTIEDSRGAVARGYAGDGLPPRWFDKDASKDFRRNVDDQLAAIRAARDAFILEGGDPTSRRTVHDLWKATHPSLVSSAATHGTNKLTMSFGVSLLERATIDATCRLVGLPFHRALREGALGYEAGDELPATPLKRIFCRHTVGLGDAIRAEDVAPRDRLGDGLPEALEEAIAAHGLRYFKVKVSGDRERDLERLCRMAELFATACPGREGYRVSLDGNEQYESGDDLVDLLRRLESSGEAGRQLVASVFYIEQPLKREVALAASAREALGELVKMKPVIIDESDDDIDAFERAIELGYRGCSVKNCKGVFKALQNRALCHERNRELGSVRYFQTGEDLANLPVLPLQQDLTTLATLGIDNAERNGHHYFRGLGHLSPAERRDALQRHEDLYEQRGEEVFLRISAGVIQCASLHDSGYGYASTIDFESRLPLDRWRFERLGLSGD